VIDRVTGAASAELAAVELHKLTGRRRQTVLAAVRAVWRSIGTLSTL
jgi:hypothetical protein